MTRPLSIEAVCGLIEGLLPQGYPAIEAVAPLLGVSTRTLQRLLSARGVCYSDLIDRCRCRAACEALELTRDSVQEIGAALGYRNASSFARAFRRWTGIAPRAYRNRALGRQDTDEPDPQGEALSETVA